MTQSMNPQIIAALADSTRLNEGEGLLLALHPDFILAVRPGMNEDERENAADALLSAAEGLSLPVLEDPVEDEGVKRSHQRIPSDMLGYFYVAPALPIGVPMRAAGSA